MSLRWRLALGLQIVLAMTFFGSVEAAVYDVGAVGSRAEGMGGAMTALANDSMSPFFYNPAALSDVSGTNIQVGAFGVHFPVRYESETGYDEENGKFASAPYFGFTCDKADPIFWGVGMYGTLGMGFDYDKDEDHGVSHRFFSESGNMFLSPSIGYRLNEKLSLGAGVNIIYGTLDMGMPLPTGGSLRIEADGFCLGANLGVLYKVSRSLNLGLRWRSRMRSVLKGDASLSGTSDDVTAYLHWPANVTFGVALKVSPRFVVLVDLEWMDYSRFSGKSHLTYDTLTFLNMPFIEDMRDAKRIHVGCEYLLNEKTALRAGYLYNPWCIPKEQVSPLNPGNTFHTIHAGTGLKLSDKLDFDFAAVLTLSDERKVVYTASGFPGTYNMLAYIFDMGFTYHF